MYDNSDSNNNNNSSSSSSSSSSSANNNNSNYSIAVKTLSKEIMISNNVIPKAWHSPSHLLARKALAKCITHLIMVY